MKIFKLPLIVLSLLTTFNIFAAETYFSVAQSALKPLTTNYVTVTTTNNVTTTNIVKLTNTVVNTITNYVAVTNYVSITNQPPVTNNPVNVAPVISGILPTYVVVRPNTLTLTPTVVDDGKPSNNLVFVKWAMTTGPTTNWIFNDTSSLNTTVTFPVDGQYFLRLTASDSQLQSFKDTEVIVTSLVVPPVTNPPPVTNISNMAWKDVGVQPSIPNRTTIYKTFNPGATAQQIQDAINSCPANQVVYLNAGTYNIGQIRILNKNDWTLRGAGPGKTILKGSAWAAILNLGQFPWITEWATPPANVSSGATKGSTSVNVSSINGITAGSLVMFEMDNVSNDIFGFGSGSANSAGRLRDGNKVQAQIAYVKSAAGNVVTFYPPLNFDFPSSRNPKIVAFGTKIGPQNAGIEDLTVAGSSGGYGVWWQGAYNCWAKNVELTDWDTFGFEIQYSINVEVRDSYIHEPHTYNWSKGYSLQFDTGNNCLIENNLFYKYQDGVLLQGSCSGNVISYNALIRSYAAYNGVDIMLSGMAGNHTPYPVLNLYEGNFVNGFHADYYYGPSAKGTLLRNYFHASDPDVTQNRIAVNLDSHQWDYNVIGNILGGSGTSSDMYSALIKQTLTWVNKSTITWEDGTTSTDNFSYAKNRLFRLGYPYIGNNSSSGTANPPTSGNLAALDMSVKPGGSHQTIINGNWDFITKSVTWRTTDRTIPNSMYLASKPAWFGRLAWPPYDPNKGSSANMFSITNLPAGYKFIYGTNP